MGRRLRPKPAVGRNRKLPFAATPEKWEAAICYALMILPPGRRHKQRQPTLAIYCARAEQLPTNSVLTFGGRRRWGVLLCASFDGRGLPKQ
jgi:hypothetical protein